jgi:PAS domain S-box-containing protein
MAFDNLNVARAIESGEFLPYFQPLVSLRSGELQGFELLARWNRPQHGWIPPDEFIPIAERDGWIDLLSRELLRRGLDALGVLPHKLMLSVNISSVQLRDLNLPDHIQAIAKLSGYPLENLTLEITESALTEDAGPEREIACALRAMGCKLALDDFGTGYSSLSQLQALPFDELKVDRSFVSSMTEQRESRKIVAAVVGLGQNLGFLTVAEGVEKAEQAEMLRWLGCELGQGWIYGKPMAEEQLESFVLDREQTASPGLSNDLMGRVSISSLDSLPAQRLAQLQAVYDGAPVGLAFLDRNLRYVNLNRRLANMNGRPMAEHLGRTVSEMIPELYSSVEPLLQRSLKGEAISGVEITKPASDTSESKTILLSYEPARDEAGEVFGVSVALVDLTPIKRAEQARNESEEHFRQMLELLPQIPWIIDHEGRALDVSQRWLEITGTTDDQWRGFGWLDALHPDDRQPTIDGMRRSFETGCPIDLEFRVRKSASDAWKRMRSRGAARIGADGKIVCWYGCLEAIEDGR